MVALERADLVPLPHEEGKLASKMGRLQTYGLGGRARTIRKAMTRFDDKDGHSPFLQKHLGHRAAAASAGKG